MRMQERTFSLDDHIDLKETNPQYLLSTTLERKGQTSKSNMVSSLDMLIAAAEGLNANIQTASSLQDFAESESMNEINKPGLEFKEVSDSVSLKNTSKNTRSPLPLLISRYTHEMSLLKATNDKDNHPPVLPHKRKVSDDSHSSDQNENCQEDSSSIEAKADPPMREIAGLTNTAAGRKRRTVSKKPSELLQDKKKSPVISLMNDDAFDGKILNENKAQPSLKSDQTRISHDQGQYEDREYANFYEELAEPVHPFTVATPWIPRPRMYPPGTIVRDMYRLPSQAPQCAPQVYKNVRVVPVSPAFQGPMPHYVSANILPPHTMLPHLDRNPHVMVGMPRNDPVWHSRIPVHSPRRAIHRGPPHPAEFERSEMERMHLSMRGARPIPAYQRVVAIGPHARQPYAYAWRDPAPPGFRHANSGPVSPPASPGGGPF